MKQENLQFVDQEYFFEFITRTRDACGLLAKTGQNSEQTLLADSSIALSLMVVNEFCKRFTLSGLLVIIHQLEVEISAVSRSEMYQAMEDIRKARNAIAHALISYDQSFDTLFSEPEKVLFFLNVLHHVLDELLQLEAKASTLFKYFKDRQIWGTELFPISIEFVKDSDLYVVLRFQRLLQLYLHRVRTSYYVHYQSEDEEYPDTVYWSGLELCQYFHNHEEVIQNYFKSINFLIPVSIILRRLRRTMYNSRVKGFDIKTFKYLILLEERLTEKLEEIEV